MTEEILNKKYYKTEDNFWKCRKCNADILGKEVFRPVWDGIFACSGSGEVRKTVEPYCPNCETEPKTNGLPVYED